MPCLPSSRPRRISPGSAAPVSSPGSTVAGSPRPGRPGRIPLREAGWPAAQTHHLSLHRRCGAGGEHAVEDRGVHVGHARLRLDPDAAKDRMSPGALAVRIDEGVAAPDVERQRAPSRLRCSDLRSGWPSSSPPPQRACPSRSRSRRKGPASSDPTLRAALPGPPCSAVPGTDEQSASRNWRARPRH